MLGLMRYMVTGATGFIGGHLVRQLVRSGHDVVALVRQPAGARELEDVGVELVRGDLLDRPSLEVAMTGADGVFHLAAWYRVGARDSSAAEAVNVHGTRNVLETARSAGIGKIVYTSTLAVMGDTGGEVVDETYRHDGPWLSEYDRTKWLAHYQVAAPMAEAGVPVVIVQPGIVYGPGDHSNVGDVLRDYLRRRLPVKPQQGGCWSHVADTARGHVQAMERGRIGESYILGGECRLWADVLRLAQEITGVEPPRLTLPPALARLSALLLRPVAALAPLPQMYHPETLRVAAGTTYWGSDAKARREIGWDPRSLREGLAETLRAEQAAMA
jgi:nucleoside-diphosphate-sugar epimerase